METVKAKNYPAGRGINLGTVWNIKSVSSKYGNDIRWYDDGFGTLYAYREASGFRGLVRAESFEAAFNICVDEIMDDAEPDADWGDDGIFIRGGIPSGYGLETTTAQADLNGWFLDDLTPELLDELGWNIRIESDDDA